MAKSILTQAMLDAEEISNASLENAKNLVIETFAPKLTDLIRAKLNEEDDLEDEVFDDETDSEEDVTEESEDPESDDEEKKVDETVCDDEMDEEVDLDIEDDDEEELPTEEDIPSDETSDDEELDVPEELFDDEEDVTEETDDMEDTFPAEEDDEELPVESDEVPGDEEIDLDIEDDEELPVESDEIPGDEEIADDDEELPMEGDEEEPVVDDEDGLYIKKEGKLTKVTPTQALQARISELEEERDRATKAVGLLSTQIKEVNLFNAKMAYSNKLFNSRSYTSKQKIKIAEQLDRAKTVKQVKTIAEQISKIKLPKAKKPANVNPLVEYRQKIASNKKVVSESVYESDDVARMRTLSGIIE